MKGLVIRKVLVGGLQYRLLAVGVLHFLFIVVVFAATIFLPLAIQLSLDGVFDDAVRSAAHDFMALHRHVWPALGLALLLLIIHDILVSHRIAGPLLRIRREFESIAEGDLNHTIRVRKGDYLQDEAASMDAMLVKLRSRIEIIRDGHKQAVAAVDEAQRAARAGEMEHLYTTLQSARRGLAASGAVLDELLDSNDASPPPASPVRDEVAEPVGGPLV